LQAADEFFERSVLDDDVPFASLFVAVLDERKLECRYASAGHEAALLFDAHGQCRDLASTGPVLGLRGLLGCPGFGERAAALDPAGLLVMVTDGITEARRPAKDGAQAFFGIAGVMRAVREARPRLQDTAQAILRAAALHARGELDDDASIAVATFGSGEKSTAFCVPEATIGGWDTLTRAERRVAKLIADGHTNRSIAHELVVSESTVATHLRSIFGKLGVASRVQLTVSIMQAQRYVLQPVVA
jgi:DNA-binding CsgD family transcriptional regulator